MMITCGVSLEVLEEYFVNLKNAVFTEDIKLLLQKIIHILQRV